jgi:hypothetical protein
MLDGHSNTMDNLRRNALAAEVEILDPRDPASDSGGDELLDASVVETTRAMVDVPRWPSRWLRGYRHLHRFTPFGRSALRYRVEAHSQCRGSVATRSDRAVGP